MQRTKISVIIPTFNEEKSIGSLLAQLAGVEGIEVIVSDGGSTDSTREICAAFPVKIINSPLGRGPQLNFGAKAATGSVLFFVHADSKPGAVLFEAIRAAIGAGQLWGCCTLAFDINSLFFRCLAWSSNLRVRVFSSCYGDQGIFCERNLFWSMGGFPDYPLFEDLRLSRVLTKTRRAWLLPEVMITSARRFEAGGPLRVLLKMQLIKLLFALGVSPVTLRSIYKPHTK